MASCDSRTVRTAGVVLLMLLAGAAEVRGQEDPALTANECCLQLLIPMGARALGMGQALSARPGSDVVFVNPAGLGAVTDTRFLVYTSETVVSRTTVLGAAFGIEEIGTFGVTYRLIDYGESDVTDQTGNVIGNLAIFDQSLSAVFAAPLAAGLRAGLTYKLYQFSRECSGSCGVAGFSATTHMVDAGVQYTPGRIPALELGVSLLHVGFPLQVVNAEQSSSTPARVRLGAAYEALHLVRPESPFELRLAVDVEDRAGGPGQALVNFGAELSLEDDLRLWVGRAGGETLTSGTSLGVGINYDRFEFGAAKSFSNVAGGSAQPVHFSFSVRL
ncbi:MAG: hypothetical protein WEA24_11680 [Gemmatimonadota bacterium]